MDHMICKIRYLAFALNQKDNIYAKLSETKGKTNLWQIVAPHSTLPHSISPFYDIFSQIINFCNLFINGFHRDDP